MKLNSYDLSREWFNFCFDNPEKIRPLHTAILFFAIEHCNRLGWKEKFGFPSQMVMDAIGVKNWHTFSKGLNDLVGFGYIKMIQKSKNQYSSNIISLKVGRPKNNEALDKALSKHASRQPSNHYQSTVGIDKQTNKEQTNKPTIEKKKKKKTLSHLFTDSEFFDYEKFASKVYEDEKYQCFDCAYYYEAIKNWSDNDNKKTNWIATAKNWMIRDLKKNDAKLSTDAEQQINNNGKSAGFAAIDAMPD